MSSLCRAVMCLITMLLPWPVAAQSQECNSFRSQPEINACEQHLYDEADAQLNRLYRQLRARLDAKEQQALEAPERAWIAYRDRECDFETLAEEGGSIRPMEQAICARRLTLARSNELRRLLACWNDAAGCRF